MTVHLTLLGTFTVEIGGRHHELPTRKCEALLAYLALRREQGQRRDALAALLWGDVSVAQARHSLRQTIWQLNRAFSPRVTPVLMAEGEMVRLDHTAVVVDARVFECLSGSQDPQDRERAAALYQGDLLEGLHLNEARFDNWLALERSRLHHLILDIRSRQLQEALNHQEDDRVISLASSLLALDRTQEHVHRTLMAVYRKLGRPVEALQQYNICAGVLQQELGVEPDEATRRLCQEILVERARGGSGVRRVVASPQPAPSRSSLPVVLVLESDPVTRVEVERILRDAGYEVVLRPATAALPSGGAYGAVICGLAASSSRTQLLSRLRSQGYPGYVLFVTNDAPWPHVSNPRGLRVGYVRRPVRPRALLSKLRQGLAGRDAVRLE